jgi:mycothiol synthase
VDPRTSLTPQQRPPLNEEATLALARDDARHWLIQPDGELIGYAQEQPANRTAQIVVAPQHRRAGVGSSLLAALRGGTAPDVWAFGTGAPAQGFAAARGLVPIRGLSMMERVLADEPEPVVPPGVSLRPFTDADADAFLAVNAAAFADHPEQGHFSADDLANRQHEDWWDPEGLILAEDAEGVVGFHWTKRHDGDTGEVYVLGVHPRGAGAAWAAVLLDAGPGAPGRGGRDAGDPLRRRGQRPRRRAVRAPGSVVVPHRHPVSPGTRD